MLGLLGVKCADPIVRLCQQRVRGLQLGISGDGELIKRVAVRVQFLSMGCLDSASDEFLQIILDS